jgi:hypothetical protein
MAGGFQQRELSGSMFKNDRKEQPNHPDYRGDCLIGGVAYWVSGWIKTTQRGDKFLSMAYTRKADKDQPGGDGGFSTPPAPSLMDDDMPF